MFFFGRIAFVNDQRMILYAQFALGDILVLFGGVCCGAGRPFLMIKGRINRHAFVPASNMLGPWKSSLFQKI